MQVKFRSWVQISGLIVATVMFPNRAIPQDTVSRGTYLDREGGRLGSSENYEAVAALYHQSVIARSSLTIDLPSVYFQQVASFGLSKNTAAWAGQCLAICGMARGQVYVTSSTKLSYPIVGIFFMTAQAVISQSDRLEPGRVTVAIMTAGVRPGFVTNTAAVPSLRGEACIVDASPSQPDEIQNREMTTYAVVDGSHLNMELARPHASGATIFIGNGCHYEPQATPDDH